MIKKYNEYIIKDINLIKLLDKVEKTLNIIKEKENVYFDISDIFLYGGVLKKGFNNTKDIDVFVEISDFDNQSDNIQDLSDFKDFLHELPREYDEKILFFNNKFIDINIRDYSFDEEFDIKEPRISLYEYYYKNKNNM